MPFTTRTAFEMQNAALLSRFVTTRSRIPLRMFDLRTAGGFDMKVLKKVTHSTAPLIEYDHLAVQTEVQIQVFPDATVRLVLRYQLDGPACTYTFCGRSYTLIDLEAILLAADKLVNLPSNWKHNPVQLRKVLLMLKKVSDKAFSWGDSVYPSLESLHYHITATLETQVRAHAICQVVCGMVLDAH